MKSRKETPQPWTVGIIGLGHVGTITRDALQLRSRVVTYDIAQHREYPYAELVSCDYVVICVNTPSLPTGAADLSQVHAAFEALPPNIPAVLRSTVPPGTTLDLAATHRREVIFWPEYFGETRFHVPTFGPLDQRPFQIFGAHRTEAFSTWLDLVAESFGPLVRLYQLPPTEAETVKYMENCYFAVKTTFVNEFRRLCDSLGLDWQSVREGWLLDPRVDRDHSDAFKTAPGYGGRCLPKDVRAILAHADAVGANMPLLHTVRAINDETVAAHEPEPMTDWSTNGHRK